MVNQNKLTAKEEPQVLDDDFPDAFDAWLCDLQADDWIRFGDNYKKDEGSK